MTPLEKQAEKLQKELDVLKEKIAEQNKPKGRWKPAVGDKYYFLDTDGEIEDYTWDGCPTDESLWSQGGVFKTKEYAQREIDRRVATQSILDIIVEERGDWTPNWSDGEWKRFIAWDYSGDTVAFNDTQDWQFFPNEHFFPEEAWDRIKERLNDEDVRLYCGVRDDS